MVDLLHASAPRIKGRRKNRTLEKVRLQANPRECRDRETGTCSEKKLSKLTTGINVVENNVLSGLLFTIEAYVPKCQKNCIEVKISGKFNLAVAGDVLKATAQNVIYCVSKE